MAAPVAGNGLIAKLKANPKLLAALGVGLVVLFYWRAHSASAAAATVTNPNAIDPATGMTYAAEQQAADAAAAAGSAGGSDTSTSGIDPNALTQLQTGFSTLATQQANDEASLQSAVEALAQAQQELADLGNNPPPPAPSAPDTSTTPPALSGSALLVQANKVAAGKAPVSSLAGVDTSTAEGAYAASVVNEKIAAAAKVVPVSTPNFAAATTAKTAAAKAAGVPVAFGGIVGTTKTKTGATLTTYASGRVVEQAPGKTAFVVKK